MIVLSNGKLVSLGDERIPSPNDYPELVQFWNDDDDIIVATDVESHVWVIREEKCTKISNIENIESVQCHYRWINGLYLLIMKTHDGQVIMGCIDGEGENDSELSRKIIFDNLGKIEHIFRHYLVCTDGWVYVTTNIDTNEYTKVEQDLAIIELTGSRSGTSLMLGENFKVYIPEEKTNDSGDPEFHLGEPIFDKEPVCLIYENLILTDSGDVYIAEDRDQVTKKDIKFMINIPDSEAVKQMIMYSDRFYVLYNNGSLTIYEEWKIAQSIHYVDCLSGCVKSPKLGSKK